MRDPKSFLSNPPFRAAIVGLLWIVNLGAPSSTPAKAMEGRQGGKAVAPGELRYLPGRLLVRFRKGVSKEFKDAIHARAGGVTVHDFHSVEGLQVVKLPTNVAVKEAIQKYLQDPDVLYAEPDYIMHVNAIPNDPRYPQQWNLNNTGQNVGDNGGSPGHDIRAERAWDITTGSRNVVVAILDTGIDYNHQDLASNMFRNTADCNNNGIDDDGNGYVDDCHGIDTVNGDSNPMDDHGHGTAVAGIIGAAGNNSLGITGINWQASLLACKWLNALGYGPLSAALSCFDYVALMKDRGVNIVATNNSWGSRSYSAALYDAIAAQWKRGILCVTAAGNESSYNDFYPMYPANYYLPNVISVAASTNIDSLADFSNSGRYTVHLAAPGYYVLTTDLRNAYVTASGTSISAPHVAGVTALLQAANPALDWREIKNLILTGGDPTGTAGQSITGRRLSAYGAMACSGSTVFSRLLPFERPDPTNTYTVVIANPGIPIDLAALNLNCGQPNGEIDVRVYQTGETMTLKDDGVNPDQEAGDGIYSGQWTPVVGGGYQLVFPGNDVVNVSVFPKYEYSTANFNYRNVSGTNLNLDGTSAKCMAPPFPVVFGLTGFNNVCISGNGTISFSSAFNQALNQPIPTAQASTLIAPFWDSLYPVVGTDQNVFWDVTGTSPNREFIIEWRNVRHYDCRSDGSATVKFQVVFFESKSSFLFNYADTTFGGACTFADRGGTATVGVQVASSSGTQFSFNTAGINDGSALLWRLPAAVLVSPKSLTFFDQRVGTSSIPSSVVLHNISTVSATISSISITGDFGQTTSCAGALVPPNNYCSVSVTFAPTTTGLKTGTLTIDDDGLGSPHVISLSGSGYDGVGPVINISPTSLSFGDQLSGTSSQPQFVTVTNTGDAGLGIWAIDPLYGNFTQTNNCGPIPRQLPPGANCTINVTFAPYGIGTSNATLNIAHTPGSVNEYVALSGNAIAPIANLSTTSLSFPDQPVGIPSAPQAITLSNTGTAPLTITGFSTPTNFSETNNCGSSLALGASCTISVTFNPTWPSFVYEVLRITDNSLYGSQYIFLTGKGLLSFGVSADPSTLTVVRGTDAVSPTISATSQYGYTGTITLVCLPDAPIQCTMDPTSIVPGQSSVLKAVGISKILGYSAKVGIQGASGNQYVVQTVSILISDFTVVPSPSAASVSAGQSADFTLTLTPINGFNGEISLSCSNLPKDAQCSFSPSSLTLDGSNPGTTKATITTTVRSTVVPRPRRFIFNSPFSLKILVLWALAFIALGNWGVPRRRRRWVALAAICVVFLFACGGGGSGSKDQPPVNGTPAGIYYLTLKATSGDVSHSAGFSLTVK